MAAEGYALDADGSRRLNNVGRLAEGALLNPEVQRATGPRIVADRGLEWVYITSAQIQGRYVGYIQQTDPTLANDFLPTEIACWVVPAGRMGVVINQRSLGKRYGSWTPDPVTMPPRPVLAVGDRCPCPLYCGGRTELLGFDELIALASEIPQLMVHWDQAIYQPYFSNPDPDGLGCIDCDPSIPSSVGGNCNDIAFINESLTMMSDTLTLDFVGPLGLSGVVWVYDSGYVTETRSIPCGNFTALFPEVRIAIVVLVSQTACVELSAVYTVRALHPTLGGIINLYNWGYSSIPAQTPASRCCQPYGTSDLFQHGEVEMIGSSDPEYQPNLGVQFGSECNYDARPSCAARGAATLYIP